MNTQMTYPDYQGIINELVKGLTPESHPWTEILRCDRISRLREFRTMRLGGGRQSGKTSSLVERLITDTDSILFVKSAIIRESIIKDWKTRLESNISTMNFLTPADANFHERIVSQHAFGSSDNQTKRNFFEKPIMKKAPKLVMIDDASFHVHFFVNVLYDWIAETADPDPVIVLMG